MVKGGKGKAQRQRELANSLANNPLLKDGELAEMFGVSIQTIRLDRSQLQIPELRERMKSALQSGNDLRSLGSDELVGELLEIQVGQYGISQLIIKSEMAFRKNLVARGHHLFAQANSLAVALVDAEIALTGTANVMFKHPVRVGEAVLAKATVNSQRGNKTIVRVVSKVNDNTVFEGIFTVFALEEEGKQ